MPSITLKSIDESLYRKLADAARNHRRSLTKEIVVALEHHVRQHPARDSQALLARVRDVRNRCKTPIRKSDIKKWIDTGRP